jgi:hypothetical protein
MNKVFSNWIRITLFIDFLITFGFGVVSWISLQETFGTLFSNSSMNSSLILSLLSSLSLFYILIGLVCFIGFKSKFPFNNWVAAIMTLRHGWIGITSIAGLSIKKEWFVGNPYPDIIIHLIFVCAYFIGIYFSIKLNNSILLNEGRK